MRNVKSVRRSVQRLVDGKTLGIAVKPLGAINASFYTLKSGGGLSAARLRFNVL